MGYAGILRPRKSRTLDAIGRIASTPAVPRPGESLPASAPALAAAPLPRATTRRSRATCSTLRASFRASYAEGAMAELFAACTGGTVLTAWALQLGATPLLIGLLGALPLAAQVFHLPSALLTQLLGSKRVAVGAIAASRLVWLPLVVLPFMPLPAEAELRLFIAVVATAAALSVLGNNAWVAWMGDLVPGAIRGRFFSRRTVYITAAGTVASLAAGVALDAVTPHGGKPLMLAGLAAVACAAGIASGWLLLRQAAPGRAEERERPDLRALARAAADPRTRPWLIYLFCWNAAVALSASFFAYHMLENLRMAFAVAALHGVAVAVVRIASAALWGRAVDGVGARPVLILCSFGIAFVPALWLLVTPSLLWPIALEAVLSGTLWAGHGIASIDLTLHSAPGSCRPHYVAVFGATSGLGFAIASVLAGLLAVTVPVRFELLGAPWMGLHVLFALSAVARAGAALTALRIEERGARPVGTLLSVLTQSVLARLSLRRLPG